MNRVINYIIRFADKKITKSDQFIPKGDDGFSGESLFGSDGIVIGLLNVAVVVASVISVIFIVYAGYQYMLSRGEQNKAETAKKAIKNALIGLAVVLLALAIQSTVTYLIGDISSS
jgi:cytochrome bd-type quinol oxidase subunit 2